MTYVPSASTPSHCSCPAGIMSESGVTKPWPEGYGDAIGITHAVSQHTLDKVEYVLELTKKKPRWMGQWLVLTTSFESKSVDPMLLKRVVNNTARVGIKVRALL